MRGGSLNAWDHEFTDNVGFYRLDVLVKRGSNGDQNRQPGSVE